MLAVFNVSLYSKLLQFSQRDSQQVLLQYLVRQKLRGDPNGGESVKRIRKDSQTM